MPQPARLRKVKLNKDGYAVDDKRYHGHAEGLFVYRAEVPIGLTWLECFEVKAPTYRKAKELIAALAWRRHRIRPVWAK